MQEKIITLLRSSSDFLSGEVLSRQLGISRAAVWKNISELRRQGYHIEAMTRRGYRLLLIPERLFPREIQFQLSTQIFGRRVIYFETLESTMREAFRLASDGAVEGTLVVAEHQSKGKGRLGRDWVSPKGQGIYMSLVLRPDMGPNDAAKITLLTAVSLCEAVNASAKVKATIKWPNDVLLNGKKIAGILTEMSADMDRVHFLVVGIGLNVNTPLRQLPSQAASLRTESGNLYRRMDILKAVLKQFENDYKTAQANGFKDVLCRWRKLSVTLGQKIQFENAGVWEQGEAVDIDDNGALIIKTMSGKKIKKISGDVIAAGDRPLSQSGSKH